LRGTACFAGKVVKILILLRKRDFDVDSLENADFDAQTLKNTDFEPEPLKNAKNTSRRAILLQNGIFGPKYAKMGRDREK
jgi:hypothetical protein